MKLTCKQFGRYSVKGRPFPVVTHIVEINLIWIPHVKWVPVTKAWRVIRLQMEETALRYGE